MKPSDKMKSFDNGRRRSSKGQSKNKLRQGTQRITGASDVGSVDGLPTLFGNPLPDPIVLKRRATAEMLACGETTLRKLCKAGLLDTVRVGGEVRITVASIKRFIAKGGSVEWSLKGASLRRLAARKKAAPAGTAKDKRAARDKASDAKDGELPWE